MKLLISTLSMLLFISNAALSQESSVPSNIVEDFKSTYVGAIDIEWEKEDNLYEVDYELDGTEHQVTYDESGQVVSERSEISESEIPESVETTLNIKFPDREVDEIEKETKDGKVVYHLELKDLIFDDKVTISSEGEIVK